MKLSVSDAKNLELEHACQNQESLNPLSEFQAIEGTIANQPIEQTGTEYAQAPASTNFDIKTAGIGGILTLLLSSPIFLQMIQGVPFAEITQTFITLIRENFFYLALIALAYIFRETIHGAFKQFIFAKVIDTKADPNKNSVEIKPD